MTVNCQLWAPSARASYRKLGYQNSERRGNGQFRKCAVLNRRDFPSAIRFRHETPKCCAGSNRRYYCGGFDSQKRDHSSSINHRINARLPIHALTRVSGGWPRLNSEKRLWVLPFASLFCPPNLLTFKPANLPTLFLVCPACPVYPACPQPRMELRRDLRAATFFAFAP